MSSIITRNIETAQEMVKDNRKYYPGYVKQIVGIDFYNPTMWVAITGLFQAQDLLLDNNSKVLITNGPGDTSLLTLVSSDYREDINDPSTVSIKVKEGRLVDFLASLLKANPDVDIVLAEGANINVPRSELGRPFVRPVETMPILYTPLI